MTLSLTTIRPDEYHTPGAPHGLNDVAGYVVVLTKFGAGKVEDFRVYDRTAYVAAVEDAHDLRLHQLHPDLAPDVAYDYARIDVLYENGDRGIL